MNKIAVTVVSTIVACGAACGGSTPPSAPAPAPNPLAVSATDASEITLPEPTTADLMSDATRAELVVVAEVTWLGPAPGRPGDPCAPQGVAYRVVDVFRGTAPASEIRVAHSVCLGRPLIDNKLVGLSPACFERGRQFVLFLRRENGRVQYATDAGPWVSEFTVWDERFGALPDSEPLRANVRKAVAAAGGAGSSTGGDPFAGGRHR